MSDLRSSLLGDDIKRIGTFQKMLDDCADRVNKIKYKNQTLQKHAGTEMEDEIALEVQKQKQFIEEEIKELKEMIDQMERKYKDTQAKNKIKILKKDAQKEIERNKTILKQFVTKSFLMVKQLKQSRAKGDSQDQAKYFVGGETNIRPAELPYNNLENEQSVIANRNDDNEYLSNRQQMDPECPINYELEMKLEREKTEILDDIEKHATQALSIMEQQALIINKGDDDLDEVQQNLQDTLNNVTNADEALQGAVEIGMRRRKKYTCLAVIIVIIAVLIVGIVLIVKKA